VALEAIKEEKTIAEIANPPQSSEQLAERGFEQDAR